VASQLLVSRVVLSSIELVINWIQLALDKDTALGFSENPRVPRKRRKYL
jgi:hypothetical protein